MNASTAMSSIILLSEWQVHNLGGDVPAGRPHFQFSPGLVGLAPDVTQRDDRLQRRRPDGAGNAAHFFLIEIEFRPPGWRLFSVAAKPKPAQRLGHLPVSPNAR